MEKERLNCKSADMNLWDTCSPVPIVTARDESGLWSSFLQLPVEMEYSNPFLCCK